MRLPTLPDFCSRADGKRRFAGLTDRRFFRACAACVFPLQITRGIREEARAFDLFLSLEVEPAARKVLPYEYEL